MARFDHVLRNLEGLENRYIHDIMELRDTAEEFECNEDALAILCFRYDGVWGLDQNKVRLVAPSGETVIVSRDLANFVKPGIEEDPDWLCDHAEDED